jgi:hypothetical protein
MATITAASKVYEIPELLSIICSHATTSARISTLSASKSGFRAAVPFVWANVIGVIHLLKLIPQVKFLEGNCVVS